MLYVVSYFIYNTLYIICFSLYIICNMSYNYMIVYNIIYGPWRSWGRSGGAVQAFKATLTNIVFFWIIVDPWPGDVLAYPLAQGLIWIDPDHICF